MRPSPARDLAVGLFVLAGLAGLAYLSLGIGGLSTARGDGFVLEAAFDDIGGLKVRSPVVISGVRVGQVSSIRLDTGLRARVTLVLDRPLELPDDTDAAIRTSGLLGDQYVNLTPGGSEVLLESGGEISFTESALALESLIDRFVTNMDGKKGDEDAGDAP